MNVHAVKAIYRFEMARTGRTLLQSIVSPVISTSLYFVVFGAAIGSRITAIDGVSYGAFIVPGLIMLSLVTQSISNGSFGIFCVLAIISFLFIYALAPETKGKSLTETAHSFAH